MGRQVYPQLATPPSPAFLGITPSVLHVDSGDVPLPQGANLSANPWQGMGGAMGVQTGELKNWGSGSLPPGTPLKRSMQAIKSDHLNLSKHLGAVLMIHYIWNFNAASSHQSKHHRQGSYQPLVLLSVQLTTVPILQTAGFPVQLASFLSTFPACATSSTEGRQ